MSVNGENERQPDLLGRAAITAAFIHFGILFPLTTLAFLFGAHADKQKAEEVELSFEAVDPATLPPDLPPIDPEEMPRAPEPRPKLAVRPDTEEAMPEKLPEQPPEPEQEKPPPPKPEQKTNLKSVEFEIDKEEEPSPEAQFLAEKSNRVEQETRAERTNLEKEQRGEASSSPSDRQDPEVGDDKDKVARLEDQKSKQGRQAPDVTPHQRQSLAQSSESESKSLLRMRETSQRRHEVSPETADNALPRDPQGVLAMPDADLQAMRDIPGRSGQSSRTSLRLSSKQYQYLFGEDAAAAERFAQTERSRKQGRFSKAINRAMSALENFIPEVRPGNQTALNTRAAPFAAFIARMHRNIHEGWGFGFLPELDSRSMSDPLNRRDLITRLEIVLAGDGTIDNVKVIRTSGVTGFDVAAVDVVYNAAPFPDPPPAIRSRNGKIYVHWSFHRDERQCATSHTDYYILDNPPSDSDTVPEPGGYSPARSASAAAPPSGRPSSPSARPSAGAPERNLERLEGPPDRHRGPPASPEENLEANRAVQRERANADDPEAQGVADDWFQSFVQRDVARMVQHASFPFKSRSGVAARSARELTSMLRDLANENGKSARLGGVNVHTAAGIRSIVGSIPPAFGEGGGLLFAVGSVDSDRFILVLARHGSRWKAVGMIRV